MRKFDYSFLNNGFLPASLVNLTSSIAALRTMAGVRREEYLWVFSELEAVAKIQSVNRYKGYYYDALQQSSSEWENGQNDYFPFMENFLSTLYMCYKELDKRFAVVHGKKVTKKARIEATVLNSLTPLSKADICKILPDISPTTVEAVLGNMVRTGSIRKIGSSRAIRYIKA